MDATEIIKRGIVTEKSVHLQEVDVNQQRRLQKGGMTAEQQTHQYVFEVAFTANKIMIRKAIEELFPEVTVLAVNTMHMPGKARTIRTRKGARRSEARPWKKAIITVPANDTITELQP